MEKTLLAALLKCPGSPTRVDKEAEIGGSHGLLDRSAAGGTLGPRGFLGSVLVLYLFGLAGQLLTAPIILARVSLWPFLLIQAVLIGIWYLLHARRLRDAARGMASARGIAAIHILAIVLLVLVGAFYMETVSDEAWMPESLLLIRQLIAFTRGAGDWLTILGLIACAALLVPPAFSVWAAMLPGRRA